MTEATIAWELCNWRQWLSCEEGQEEGNWRFEPTHVGRGAGVAGRRPGLEQLPAQPAIDLRQHLTTTTTTPPSLAQEARSGPNFLIFTLSSQPPGSLAKDYPSPPLSLALGLQPMSPSYRTSRGYVRLVLAFSRVHLLPLDIPRLWGGLYPMQKNGPARVVRGLVGIRNVTEKFCFS